jgi:large subunit ribosomal protein L28
LRRRFLPNLQNVSFLSERLKRSFRMHVATGAIRSVEASGGIDQYLLKTPKAKLGRKAIAIKKVLEKI